MTSRARGSCNYTKRAERKSKDPHHSFWYPASFDHNLWRLVSGILVFVAERGPFRLPLLAKRPDPLLKIGALEQFVAGALRNQSYHFPIFAPSFLDEAQAAAYRGGTGSG